MADKAEDEEEGKGAVEVSENKTENELTEKGSENFVEEGNPNNTEEGSTEKDELWGWPNRSA